MRDNDLSQLALGIASSDLDAGNKRLDIRLDFKTGARFDCPECKAAGCPVHDTTEKTWRKSEKVRKSGACPATIIMKSVRSVHALAMRREEKVPLA